MKKLDNSHRKQALAYVAEEPEFNLFITGDIINCGMTGDIVNTYTADDWNDDGNTEFPYFILDYLGNFLVYSKNSNYDVQAVGEFLSSQTISCINGKQEIVEQLCPFFPDRRVKRTYMARLNEVNPAFPFSDYPVQKLGESDLEQLCDLYLSIEEFSATYYGQSREKIIDNMRINMESGCYYGLYRDRVLMAVAGTSAATDESAMIIGVATRKGFRKQGYASAVVETLCKENLADGKSFLCLFYDNPSAGSIYRKIGFKELGIYTMLPKNIKTE